MTVYNAIIDAWELGGEPSDLDPFKYDAAGDISLDTNGNYLFDTTSKGYKYFIDQYSRAQVALANWRRKNNRFVKFKKFIKKFQITLGTDGELDGILDLENNLFTFDGLPEEAEKYLENLILFIDSSTIQEFNNITPSNYDLGDLWIQNGVYRRASVKNTVFNGADFYVVDNNTISDTYLRIIEFIDNGDGTFTVYFDPTAFDNLQGIKKLNVSGRLFVFKVEGDISKKTRPYFIEMKQWPFAILNISQGGKRLTRTEYRGSLYDPSINASSPSEFLILGQRIYFDAVFNDKQVLEFEVYEFPPSLVDFNSEFTIPTSYHEALLTWVEWRMAKRAQEFEKAFYIKRDLSSIIEWTMNEEEFEFMQETLGNFQARMEE